MPITNPNVNYHLNPNLPPINTNGPNISDYFNYGYTHFTWKDVIVNFKTKIKALQSSRNQLVYQNDYVNEYTLQENQNEKSYIWNLPIDMGGLGEYTENPCNINYFDRNSRRDQVTPPIEYNKFHSYYVSLPSQDRSGLNKDAFNTFDLVPQFNDSPRSLNNKDNLNNTNTYLNNNSINMSNNNHRNISSSISDIDFNKVGNTGKLNSKNNEIMASLISNNNDGLKNQIIVNNNNNTQIGSEMEFSNKNTFMKDRDYKSDHHFKYQNQGKCKY